MNEREIDEAAKHLAAARLSGRPGARLPESCRPADIESALAIQRRVVALMGQDIGGWKCSLPPAAGRINAAPILAPTIVRTSPCAVTATGVDRKNRARSRVRDGRRSAAARATLFRGGSARRDRRNRIWCWSSSARAMPRPPKSTGSKCWRTACRTRGSSSVRCCRMVPIRHWQSFPVTVSAFGAHAVDA